MLPLLRQLGLVCGLLLGASSCVLFRPKPPVYDPFTLESGVIVQDRVVSEFEQQAAPGDELTIEYEIRLAETQEVVDASIDRGEPTTFFLGEGLVPPGLEQGLVGMTVRSRRRLWIPAALGYGTVGRPPRIPPNADLEVDVELIEVVPAIPLEEPSGDEPSP